MGSGLACVTGAKRGGGGGEKNPVEKKVGSFFPSPYFPLIHLYLLLNLLTSDAMPHRIGVAELLKLYSYHMVFVNPITVTYVS